MSIALLHKGPTSPRIGTRIEIPVHYDAWMRGARYGKVTGVRAGQPGKSAYIFVRLDHPQMRRPLKVWAPDWEYCKELDQ